jgi:hypothetical protein
MDVFALSLVRGFGKHGDWLGFYREAASVPYSPWFENRVPWNRASVRGKGGESAFRDTKRGLTSSRGVPRLVALCQQWHPTP